MKRADTPLATRLLVGAPEATAGEVVAELATARPETAEVVFVVDAGRVLLGVVELPALLAAPKEATLRALMRTDVHPGHPGQREEWLAHAALRSGLPVLPVVDEAGRLVGAVTAPVLLAILRREHVEDLHRLAGITREGVRSREALEAPPLRRARHRLPWLLVGLAGSALATFVVSRFEGELEANVAVAFFVPAIVYLADAVGTQAEAIAVRGLSLGKLSLGALLLGELRTGLLIGALLGALAAGATFVSFGDGRLASAVGLAIAAASSLASALGILFPWLLHRLGADPAFGSGPVATVVQDVASVTIYFVLVHALAAP